MAAQAKAQVPVIPEASAVPDKPTRFVHPEAFQVVVLTPNDGFAFKWVSDRLRDEFDFLETPPQLTRELKATQLFPGVVLYIAQPFVARKKGPSGRFESTKELVVSSPIRLADFFGRNRNAGLDLQALIVRITDSLQNDPRGQFFVVRRTNDGGLKIFDN